jgi:hypothetical protein
MPPIPFVPLVAVQIHEWWYALPLIIVVSVVYSGTRYERPDDILVGAVRSIVWVCGFMGIIFAILWLVSLML